MEAFTVLDAKAAPLMRQNVNTDIIIPIHRLRDVAQADLGKVRSGGRQAPTLGLHDEGWQVL